MSKESGTVNTRKRLPNGLRAGEANFKNTFVIPGETVPDANPQQPKLEQADLKAALENTDADLRKRNEMRLSSAGSHPITPEIITKVGELQRDALELTQKGHLPKNSTVVRDTATDALSPARESAEKQIETSIKRLSRGGAKVKNLANTNAVNAQLKSAGNEVDLSLVLTAIEARSKRSNSPKSDGSRTPSPESAFSDTGSSASSPSSNVASPFASPNASLTQQQSRNLTKWAKARDNDSSAEEATSAVISPANSFGQAESKKVSAQRQKLNDTEVQKAAKKAVPVPAQDIADNNVAVSAEYQRRRRGDTPFAPEVSTLLNSVIAKSTIRATDKAAQAAAQSLAEKSDAAETVPQKAIKYPSAKKALFQNTEKNVAAPQVATQTKLFLDDQDLFISAEKSGKAEAPDSEELRNKIEDIKIEDIKKERPIQMATRLDRKPNKTPADLKKLSSLLQQGIRPQEQAADSSDEVDTSSTSESFYASLGNSFSDSDDSGVSDSDAKSGEETPRKKHDATSLHNNLPIIASTARLKNLRERPMQDSSDEEEARSSSTETSPEPQRKSLGNSFADDSGEYDSSVGSGEETQKKEHDVTSLLNDLPIIASKARLAKLSERPTQDSSDEEEARSSEDSEEESLSEVKISEQIKAEPAVTPQQNRVSRGNSLSDDSGAYDSPVGSEEETATKSPDLKILLDESKKVANQIEATQPASAPVTRENSKSNIDDPDLDESSSAVSVDDSSMDEEEEPSTENHNIVAEVAELPYTVLPVQDNQSEPSVRSSQESHAIPEHVIVAVDPTEAQGESLSTVSVESSHVEEEAQANVAAGQPALIEVKAAPANAPAERLGFFARLSDAVSGIGNKVGSVLKPREPRQEQPQQISRWASFKKGASEGTITTKRAAIEVQQIAERRAKNDAAQMQPISKYDVPLEKEDTLSSTALTRVQGLWTKAKESIGRTRSPRKEVETSKPARADDVAPARTPFLTKAKNLFAGAKDSISNRFSRRGSLVEAKTSEPEPEELVKSEEPAAPARTSLFAKAKNLLASAGDSIRNRLSRSSSLVEVKTSEPEPEETTPRIRPLIGKRQSEYAHPIIEEAPPSPPSRQVSFQEAENNKVEKLGTAVTPASTHVETRNSRAMSEVSVLFNAAINVMKPDEPSQLTTEPSEKIGQSPRSRRGSVEAGPTKGKEEADTASEVKPAPLTARVENAVASVETVGNTNDNAGSATVKEVATATPASSDIAMAADPNGKADGVPANYAPIPIKRSFLTFDETTDLRRDNPLSQAEQWASNRKNHSERNACYPDKRRPTPYEVERDANIIAYSENEGEFVANMRGKDYSKPDKRFVTHYRDEEGRNKVFVVIDDRHTSRRDKFGPLTEKDLNAISGLDSERCWRNLLDQPVGGDKQNSKQRI